MWKSIKIDLYSFERKPDKYLVAFENWIFPRTDALYPGLKGLLLFSPETLVQNVWNFYCEEK